MKILSLPLLLCLLLPGRTLLAQSSPVIREYIERFKEVAMEEMKRTGVPASITLAQGIHETEAGRSVLVLKSNNHFGIKCKSNWTGESVSHDDDARGECFRKYNDPLDSYKDHSDFLRNGARYASLFQLDPTDYEGWAHGLKKAGYATNPKYPQLLIKLIRDYGLQDYTLIAMGKKTAPPAEVWASVNTANESGTETSVSSGPNAASPAAVNTYPQGIFKINETNVVFVAKGTPYLLVAQQHHISLARLFEFNDREPAETAEADGLVFLQRKRKTGLNETHTVAEGENLYGIAQAEGIRLEYLREYNFLKEGMEPAPGAILCLRKTAPVRPALAGQERLTGQPAPEAVYLVHTVQPKETMFSIARRYEVNMDDVLKWNGLASSDLKSGQQLRINKK